MNARTRETIQVGDTGSFTKTITEQDVLAFAGASGDFNPLHIDEEYAKRSIFGHRIAHGILTAGIISTVLGSELPGLGTIFVELHIRFLKPVYFGDTVRATAVVEEIINPKRVRLLVSCANQNGEDVAIGNAIVIPPKDTKVLSPSPHDGRA
ncbi:MAG: MaoC family dehydratase [Planctomycetes bacterium]|nr:MaoC family dehydratase [Planctomycetota bacterium]MBI3836263.1 MaoC family dehydratase [Planctomycetota bacterium]